MKELYSIGGLKIIRHEIQDNNIVLHAYSPKKSCKCPLCNRLSSQVRSSYTRKLMDLPSGGHPVSIVLKVRKFKCTNTHCTRKIFSERYPDYTKSYSRKTNRVVEHLSSILVEVSSRKGSYLSGLNQMKQSPSTCLRMVSSIPIPVPSDARVIGIDDWAFRKGVNYGSIIVNAETGRPIDLINSRNELEVTSWLRNHPEIKIVTRDRASSYSKAISTALPSCDQIADKFHIVKNLTERVYEVIKKQYSAIKEEFIYSLEQHENPKSSDEIAEQEDKGHGGKEQNRELADSNPQTEGTLSQKEFLYHKIHELYDDGISIRKIASILQVHRETVRHYLRYNTFPKKRIVYTNNYEAYLDIIATGCGQGKNIKEIFAKIKQEGFKGQASAFYTWFHKNYPDYNHKRKESQKEMMEKKNPTILFNSLSPRVMSIYISNPAWGVVTNEIPGKGYLLMQRIIQSSPLLQNLREIVASFKKLLKNGMPEQLEEWIEKVSSYKLPDINSFVKGLKTDIEAVQNAIIYTWTNGFVEGNVNRLKTKKREMYGRAGFELLRRKVILSKMG